MLNTAKNFVIKYKYLLIVVLVVLAYLYYENNMNSSKLKKVEFNDKKPEETEKKLDPLMKNFREEAEKTDNDYWTYDGDDDDQPAATKPSEFTHEDLGSKCAGANAAFVSSDLLPKTTTKDQPYAPDLKGMQLLDATDYIGVDTVSNTMRNANLQIRADPPNPKTVVSPWINSTIDPDPFRKGLDC